MWENDHYGNVHIYSENGEKNFLFKCWMDKCCLKTITEQQEGQQERQKLQEA